MKIDVNQNNWRYYQFFDNGYGISIMRMDKPRGGSYGLELAVLKGTVLTWEICYDTPITGDVLGHLTEEDMEEAINKVKALPKESEVVK